MNQKIKPFYQSYGTICNLNLYINNVVFKYIDAPLNFHKPLNLDIYNLRYEIGFNVWLGRFLHRYHQSKGDCTSYIKQLVTKEP